MNQQKTYPAASLLSLRISAGLLMASGLIHLVIWFASGTQWEGAESWRKPALFGVSTGVTLYSLSLLWARMAPLRWDRELSIITALAAVVEVFLISMQTWRGVASHFNKSTPVDAAVHWGMDVCIVILFVSIVILTIRCRELRDVSEATATAARQGMLLLTISCAIGFVILGIGMQQQSLGIDPSTYGAAGVTKFPHGVAIHALQWLWLLARSYDFSLRKTFWNQRLVAIASIGFWGLLFFSLLQTFSGRARLEWHPVFTPIFAVSATLIGVPSVIALNDRLRSLAIMQRWFVNRSL